MSSTDVGDAVELTYSAAVGTTVTVSWLDPDLVPVFEDEAVPESPPASGLFPKVFLPTRPGVWTAVFTGSGASTNVEQFSIRANALTGPPPLATVGDVGEQFGTMTVAQQSLAGTLVRAASKLVRSRFPRIDAQIAAGLLDPEVVALVVTNMVLRVLRNPGGLRSETIGPFSKSYDTGDAAGLLTITKDEHGMLVPTRSGAGAFAVGSIMMRPGLAPPPTGLTRGW